MHCLSLSRKRDGNITDWSPLIWLGLSVVVCFGMFFAALSFSTADQDNLFVVRVYCASAAVKPVNKIVDRFNSSDLATSKKVVVDIVRTGGSGALAGQISTENLTGVQQTADVFVCADSHRMSDLINRGAITTSFPVAAQHPVIAIGENAALDLSKVDGLPSLLNSKLKIGVGSASSAIGFETDRIAKLEDCDVLLQNRKPVEFENVMSLAQALSIGSVDAAILWDSTVAQFNQTKNRPIKIVAFLNAGVAVTGSKEPNSLENKALTPENLPLSEGSDKFSLIRSAPDTRRGCFVEVGRSKSVSSEADSFFEYLSNNRDAVLKDFIDAGFSNNQLEPSLDNGR